MKCYYKLFVVPCMLVVISVYFAGIKLADNIDSVNSPKAAAAMLEATDAGDDISEEKRQAAAELEAADGKLNINTATTEQLMTLNGIGEAYAEAIIAKRREIGGFKTVEDLMLVKGIGKSRFEKLKDFVTVE